MMNYDYIIAGAGCAGLSLLYRMMKEPKLAESKILVVDKDDKKSNDRTWCFWEKEAGIFEEIIHKRWDKLAFLSDDFKKELDIQPYSYKMILGIDFYKFILSEARKRKNITFLKEEIVAINTHKKGALLQTRNDVFKANYIFNSTGIFNPEISTKNSLLQHFKGWVIKTEEDFFDDNVGTLMDFSVSQEHGATFMYVLPTSKREALVEYTLFTPKLLDKTEYLQALENYIKNDLKITKYTIVHEEFGVIPMSLAKFRKNPKPNVINLGTAGGYTKASSGYTFQFIQKDVANIVEQLKVGKSPVQNVSFSEKVYNWYDSTLIDVLLSKKLTGKQVFETMFKKVPPAQILAFLGNESALLEDINIMKSLPILTFASSGIKQLGN